ncbi:hypothetical protein [Sorangium sp. So ce385]|uniref:hypothetical protein n=1 Tax=Sorangium sp. So ce385 TaxID=3133308 RepID=UPI003F5BC77A
MYRLGIDRVLHELFNHLKADNGTVYVMGIQLRLRSNLFVVGELHNCELEALAADPLFVRSCGGIAPSLEPPVTSVTLWIDAHAAARLGEVGRFLRWDGRVLATRMIIDQAGGNYLPVPRRPGRPSLELNKFPFKENPGRPRG